MRIIQNYSIFWSKFRYSPHSHSRRTVYCGQKSFILPQSPRPRPIPIQDQMMRVRKSPFNALIKRAIDGQLTGSNAAPDFNCAAYFAYNFSQGIVYRACSRMAGWQLGVGGAWYGAICPARAFIAQHFQQLLPYSPSLFPSCCSLPNGHINVIAFDRMAAIVGAFTRHMQAMKVSSSSASPSSGEYEHFCSHMQRTTKLGDAGKCNIVSQTLN